MATVVAPEARSQPRLIGAATPSPAGPAEPVDPALVAPPSVPLPRFLQVLHLAQREIEFVFRWQRRLGGVFRISGFIPGGPVVTGHPDHVRSLFTADPSKAPSLTAESALLPIVGPNSVLTANGARHLRQRKLLLPPFHGEAIDRYVQMITEITEREIDRWPVGNPIALAPRMQAITAGILGIDGAPARARVGAPYGRQVRGQGLHLADRQARGADEHRPRRADRTRAAGGRGARPVHLSADREAACGRRPRGADGHPLPDDAREDRGR